MTINLDHNATTQPAPEVVAAMTEALALLWHNPSSIHRPGQAARQQIDLARKHVAALIGARPRNITFTGTGTEAIDLAIRGHLLARGLIGRAAAAKPPATIITSPVEHIAIRELVKALERDEGVRSLLADVDTEGRVDVPSIARLLDASPDTALVSIQWANNETGTIQPVREIAALCRARHVTYHCDATQWVGKGPTLVGDAAISPGGIDFDLLNFAPHKFHGPKGVGVLYQRPGVRTAPLIHGEQEQGRRGGTENVPGIIGSGVACTLAAAWLADPANLARAAALRDHFERSLLAAIPDARVNVTGGPDRRLWNTSSIGFPQLEAEALLLLLSEHGGGGVCCSAGAACSSGSLEASTVIKAMRIPAEFAHGTLRFSISRDTTRAEIDAAVPIIADCVARLKQSWK